MRYSFLKMGFVSLLFVILLTACGSPPDTNTSVPTPAVYNPAVQPFDAAQAQPYVEIVNASGTAPCGVFDAGGHGAKVVTLSDYPACTASNYTIYCLNGEAQWVNDAVSAVVVSATTVEFQSAQDGICALFPAN